MNPYQRSLSFILVGGTEIIIQCGELILARGHTILHIIGRSDSVREWARKRNIAFNFNLPNSSSSLPISDHLISAANDLILPEHVIARAQRGAFNLHNSALPEYRGSFATSWAIFDGRTTHGASWHVISQHIDSGPLVAIKRFPIKSDDTAKTLNARCMKVGLELLRDKLLPDLETREIIFSPVPPSPYYPVARRAPALGVLDWRKSAEDCMRTIRALSRGRIDNSFDLPKIMSGKRCWSIGAAELWTASAPAAGYIHTLDNKRWIFGTQEGAILIDGMSRCGPETSETLHPPTKIYALSDELMTTAMTLGRKAAKVENKFVDEWAELSKLPTLHIETSSTEDRTIAKAVQMKLTEVDRTPHILTLKIQPDMDYRLHTLFNQKAFLRVDVQESEDYLTKRIREARRTKPVLIDVWNRRTRLRKYPIRSV